MLLCCVWLLYCMWPVTSPVHALPKGDTIQTHERSSISRPPKKQEPRPKEPTERAGGPREKQPKTRAPVLWGLLLVLLVLLALLLLEAGQPAFAPLLVRPKPRPLLKQSAVLLRGHAPWWLSHLHMPHGERGGEGGGRLCFSRPQQK